MHRQQQDWDEIATVDPLWAILSAPQKLNRAWDVEEFLETGRQEIDGVLERGSQWRLPVNHEQALDFGCGVGRLTGALARHFDFSLGVDLSEVMVQRARQLHPDTANVLFHTLADTPWRANRTGLSTSSTATWSCSTCAIARPSSPR